MIDCNQVYEVSKNLTVLYIEDDKNFAKETHEFFSEFFKKVDCVSDGELGIDQYKNYHQFNQAYYDIVITDISMPKKDGLELIKHIYKLNEKQSIIVLSAHNNSENLFELVNLGIEQFLLKPLNFEKVLNTIYDCSLKLQKNKNNKEKKILIKLSEAFYYNTEENILYENQLPVKLTQKESKLLEILIKNKNKVSTFSEIYTILWSKNPDLASQELLKPIVSRLRKKLYENKLESIYGSGYKLLF